MSLKSNIATLVVAGTLVAGVGVAAATTTGSSSSGPSASSGATSADCNGRDGAWPAEVNGRPKGFDAGDTGGVYLWHDNDGWHLRVTHKGHAERVFSGTISTPGRIFAERVHDERADRLSVGPNRHELSFRFTNYGYIDGVDFRTACAPKLVVNLRSDGRSLPIERIFIGRDGSHPLSDPFVIQRAQ